MKADRSQPAPEAPDGGGPRQAPLYARVTTLLRKALSGGSIPIDTVLLEGPVAELLRCTRTPVRQALQQLEVEGLVRRFEGRGYLAGNQAGEPRRLPLTADMLGLEGEAEPVRKAPAWEALYEQVERDVVHLSVFGRPRINEQELARHFNVGRTVARDVLLRLERLGLVDKDERQRWVVTPLDDDRINHLYELRWLLEPAAVRGATLAGAAQAVAPMMAGLREAMKTYPRVTPAALDKLENDLHVELLAHCPNPALLHSLERTRCVLTLSKHVLGNAAPMPRSDPFLAEHLDVLKSVADGDASGAEAALRRHLEASCAKVTQRARVVRKDYPRPHLPYVGER